MKISVCLATYNGAKYLIPTITERTLMHDSWIVLSVLNKNGIVSYVAKPTILYRQHENNVIGARNQVDSYIKNKFLTPIDVIRDNYNQFIMVNEFQHFSFSKYLKYKIVYFLKYKQ